MTYPEIYYSDEVKRILNSKPPLPKAPKAPEKVVIPPIPNEKGDSQGCAIVVLIVSIVLFIVGAMTKTFQLSMVCSFIMFISFFVVGITTNRKRAYEDELRQYNNAQAKQKEYSKQHAEYQKQLDKYQEIIKETTSEVNLQKYRRNAINLFLSKRIAPTFSDSDADNVKKGISEDYFAKKLSKEFTILTNQRISYLDTFLYPDILLIYDNLYIDIEIDEPYSNDDGSPIHYLEEDEDEELCSIDSRRNDYFNEQGFEVIRFAEEQIYLDPEECVNTIKRVINCLKNAQTQKIKKPTEYSLDKWTKEQALIMSYKKYRNYYINKTEKDEMKLSLTINPNEQDQFDIFVKHQESIEVVSYLTKIAENGHSNNQFWLGFYYFRGKGVSKDFQKALELFSKSAEQNNKMSQYYLGICFYNGYGVSQDFEKAFEWFSKSAQQETINSDSSVSQKIIKGNPNAQDLLGDCYYYGKGVVQNIENALEWYQKAANQPIYNLRSIRRHYENKHYKTDLINTLIDYYSNSNRHILKALTSLGNIFYFGKGGTKDYKKAFDFYKKAAEQGYAKAQHKLGICYYHGFGVSKDIQKGIECCKKAANSNYVYAIHFVGYLYYHGEVVPQSYETALDYFSKSAEKGNSNSQYYLGECYFNGHGITQDIKLAIEWYTKSAIQGNANAQFVLGNCYYKGNGVYKDLNKAIEWFQQAAEKGNSKAQCNLGFLYYKGIGVEIDYPKAVEWFSQSSSKGNDKAQLYLGHCYYNGEGVTKDLNKAKEWYTKSACQGNESAQECLNNCFNEDKDAENNEDTKDVSKKTKKQTNIQAEQLSLDFLQ